MPDEKPKIVEPGEVILGTSQNLPGNQSNAGQDLESIAQNEGAAQTAQNLTSLQWMQPGYVKENMAALAEEICLLIKDKKMGYISADTDCISQMPLHKEFKSMIPYIVHLCKDSEYRAAITISAIAELTKYLLKEKYDQGIKSQQESIENSGIFEALGLNGNTPLKLDSKEFTECIPEFAVVANMNARYSNITQNYYQAILTFPVEYRAFFTGALRKAVNSGKFSILNDAWSEKFVFPLEFKDVLDYAREVGEAERVSEYMKVLADAKKNF